MSGASSNGTPPGEPQPGSLSPAGVPAEERQKTLALIQKIALFVVIAGAGRALLPAVMEPVAGILVASALSVFAAAAIANELSVRLWEKGRLADFGLGWTGRSLRELFVGLGCGVGAVAVIVLVALALRFAVYESVPDAVTRWPNLAFLATVLAFGASGEEMLFHGYAFQALRRSIGDFAAIFPVGVLFGLLHLGNQNITAVAIVNTIAWGILLGWAFVLTEALWLPIGLHLGWNLGLLVSGINLSGFTIGVVGYELHWSAGDLLSGGAYGLEGSLMTTIGVVALFFVVRRANLERGSGESEVR
jgi:membrane protease YdiL (CAAX protease family)